MGYPYRENPQAFDVMMAEMIKLIKQIKDHKGLLLTEKDNSDNVVRYLRNELHLVCSAIRTPHIKIVLLSQAMITSIRALLSLLL